MDPEEPAQGAFLDVATNLLAVILIVTLFSLVSLPHKTQSSTHPAARPISMPRFVEPQRDLFPPFSRFFFVVGDRVLAWDQEALVAARLAEPNRNAGSLPQGRYEWVPEPLVTRDIDSFQVRFYLDRETALAQTPPWTPERAGPFIAELSAHHAAQRGLPVFIVHPDGMETFAPLYERLQAAGLRFRWFPQDADEPLLLGRHPAQFTDHVIYW